MAIGPFTDTDFCGIGTQCDDTQTEQQRESTAAAVIAEFVQELEYRTRHHLGYPYNLDFDYGALVELQKYSINNLGDPFVESNYGVHSRQFEVGVLDWFAKLWEIEQEDYWGYITNCGTEGVFCVAHGWRICV